MCATSCDVTAEINVGKRMVMQESRISGQGMKEKDKIVSIRLSGKCLSFANVIFTTVHFRTNVKPSP